MATRKKNVRGKSSARKRDEALSELYLAATEFYVARFDKASKQQLKRLQTLSKDAEGNALLEGATKKQVRATVAGAKEDAALLMDIAASGMKITVDLG